MHINFVFPNEYVDQWTNSSLDYLFFAVVAISHPASGTFNTVISRIAIPSSIRKGFFLWQWGWFSDVSHRLSGDQKKNAFWHLPFIFWHTRNLWSWFYDYKLLAWIFILGSWIYVDWILVVLVQKKKNALTTESNKFVKLLAFSWQHLLVMASCSSSHVLKEWDVEDSGMTHYDD